MASQIHTSQTDGRDFLTFVLQLIKSTTCTVSSYETTNTATKTTTADTTSTSAAAAPAAVEAHL